MKCRICSSESIFFAKEKILEKYNVSYFVCMQCGFVQTEEPYWLPEAYADPINRSDVGLVSRNIMLAHVTKAVIGILFDGNKKFLDYGGGYGLLVRIMRDLGFHFYRYDHHCENIFAKDFDAGREKLCQYELLTAFEVFEHLADPLKELDMMLSLSSNILFTTQLIPRPAPAPSAWWYYGIEHGQHIAFYSMDSLMIMASKYGLNLYSDRHTLHLLTKKRLSHALFKLLTRHKAARLINAFLRRKSLLQNDYQKSIDTTRLT